MAIAENGPGGNHIGRLGNLVYYMLNGKNVSRSIGESTDPSTPAQKKSRLETSMSSAFFSRTLDFLRTGFGIEAAKARDNAFNMAVKCNKKKMFKGTYPDLQIAYDQVMVSTGTLKSASNWQVSPGADGLYYSWETHPEMPWPEATDQVMMLAYFPVKEKVYFKLFGNNRLAGNDVLEIPPSLQHAYMETYVAFISADRKQVSDSIYTGNFNSDLPVDPLLIS